jgi:hypothetical protein
VPHLLGFALANKERVESLNNLAELVSKVVAWFAAALQPSGKLIQSKSVVPRTPEELEVEITREIGGKISKFNVKLNDLLIAPHGIAL